MQRHLRLKGIVAAADRKNRGVLQPLRVHYIHLSDLTHLVTVSRSQYLHSVLAHRIILLAYVVQAGDKPIKCAQCFLER